jgi:hypothetical protein
MARIKLIVTGDMEKLALHKSLQRLFPTVRDRETVAWDQPRRAHCTTSHRLRSGQAPSGPMMELAKAMLAEAGVGQRGSPADLVVVIDDVELGNLGQEAVIAEHFRAAVNALLNERSATIQERHRIREKCSFHLLKPMVESYLFGDAGALRLAGVPDGERPRLVHASDIEEFESNDPVWVPTCQAENANRRVNAPWWCHERHPKHYLEHLTERGGVFYEERNHGQRALSTLSWDRVPKDATDTPVIRSLFEDLSEWFRVPNPIPGNTNPSLFPGKAVRRENLLLRNL